MWELRAVLASSILRIADPGAPAAIAPTMREAVARLAEGARGESWTHEEFLVVCLQREVSAREPPRAGSAARR